VTADEEEFKYRSGGSIRSALRRPQPLSANRRGSAWKAPQLACVCRYRDLLALARRIGIAVVVMLRGVNVTEVDVARLSRYLRLPVVAARDTVGAGHKRVAGLQI
jgi:hypothetical protein